jgi:hypothetical protein
LGLEEQLGDWEEDWLLMKGYAKLEPLVLPIKNFDVSQTCLTKHRHCKSKNGSASSLARALFPVLILESIQWTVVL